MTNDLAAAPSRPASLWVSGILWMIVYTLALFALKKLELDRLPATIIAIAPIIPFVVFLHQFIHHLRNADELERRVQLEALAIAFPTTLVGLMLLGLLQLAVPLSEHDWSYRHIWGFLPLIYAMCLAIVWRRYR